jgi:hypothetical protein
MAKVTVSIYNPLDGKVEDTVIDSQLVNVTELGAYTIVGSGETREVTRPGIEGMSEPDTYTEAVGIGEIRIPTQYVTRIDIEYGQPDNLA